MLTQRRQSSLSRFSRDNFDPESGEGGGQWQYAGLLIKSMSRDGMAFRPHQAVRRFLFIQDALFINHAERMDHRDILFRTCLCVL